ncbi:MAG: YlxR family protein [Clostridia bacterium]|nr:YlxR family protein [Clostridia bacterium]
MAERKIPQRRCCSCMEHFDKSDLVRVLKTPEGEVVLDKSLRQNGRGAYLCKNPSCLSKVRKSRRLEASLKTPIPEEIYAALEKLCNEG